MHSPKPTMNSPDARQLPERMSYHVTREVVQDELQRFFWDTFSQEMFELGMRIQKDIREEFRQFLEEYSMNPPTYVEDDTDGQSLRGAGLARGGGTSWLPAPTVQPFARTAETRPARGAGPEPAGAARRQSAPAVGFHRRSPPAERGGSPPSPGEARSPLPAQQQRGGGASPAATRPASASKEAVASHGDIFLKGFSVAAPRQLASKEVRGWHDQRPAEGDNTIAGSEDRATTPPTASPAQTSEWVPLPGANHEPIEEFLEKVNFELTPGEEVRCSSSRPTRLTEQSNSAFSERRRQKRMSASQGALSRTTTVLKQPSTALGTFVRSVYFDYIMGLFLISNAIEIGVQVDYMASTGEEQPPFEFRLLDWIYCCIFVIELLLRILVFRGEFLRMKGWKWNLFDTVVVLFSIVDELSNLLLQGTEIQKVIDSMGVLRMLRLGRVVRLVRMVRLIPELKSMVYLIMASMGSFFWTLVLLVIVLYCSAVYFTELATDLVRDNPDADLGDIDLHWGSIFNSIISLFQAITGGDDWMNFVESVTTKDTRQLNMVVFMIYISFATLVMLNLVTGVFVEGAQRIIREDKDNEMHRKVSNLFYFSDMDCNGEISKMEFEECMELDEFDAFLKETELKKDSSDCLFSILDTDNSGSLSVEEFVEGCIKLRGPAKAGDLCCLKFDIDKFMARWQEQADGLVSKHARTHQLLNDILCIMARSPLKLAGHQLNGVLV